MADVGVCREWEADWPFNEMDANDGSEERHAAER